MRSYAKIMVGAFFALTTCGVQNDPNATPAHVMDTNRASCDQNMCKPDPRGACVYMQQQGGIQFVDCGQAHDGPAYFILVTTGEIVARCGGALMSPDAVDRNRCNFEALEGEGL